MGLGSIVGIMNIRKIVIVTETSGRMLKSAVAVMLLGESKEEYSELSS
jgi:hypothetical protein